MEKTESTTRQASPAHHPLFEIPAGQDLLAAIGRLAQTHPEIAIRALQAVFGDGQGLSLGSAIDTAQRESSAGFGLVPGTIDSRSDGEPVYRLPAKKLSKERHVDQPVKKESPKPDNPPADRIPRKAYSAVAKTTTPTDLTPGQAMILNTLIGSHERYTIDELAAAGNLARKSVENILSVLRKRKLIESHDPR